MLDARPPRSMAGVGEGRPNLSGRYIGSHHQPIVLGDAGR